MKKIISSLAVISIVVGSFIFIGMDKENNAQVLNNEASSNETKRFATFPYVTPEEAEQLSELVVLGTPIKITDILDLDKNLPITEYQFKISESIKGDVDVEGIITVYQDGAPGDYYSNHPMMELSNEYLLYLTEPIEDKYVMVGGPNGKFQYSEKTKDFVSNNSNHISSKKLSELKAYTKEKK